jgi:apolipoprotein D and lipocalin family protein
LGVWYELERYDNVDQPNGDCVTASYDVNEDGSVRVENSMTTLSNGQVLTLIGRAVLSFPDSDPLMAKLNVSFFGGKSR